MDTLTTIRPELLTLTGDQISALMPYFGVFGGIIAAILAGLMKSIHFRWPVFAITLLTLFGSFVSSYGLFGNLQIQLFNGMLAADHYSHFFNLLILGCAFFTILASLKYLDKEDLQHPEYYLLVLFSTVGMMLLASSLDLIVLFISLEIMSLSIYVLVGYRRADRRSNEAAVKYFVLGAAASAVFLYGAALLYGSTQSTQIQTILATIQNDPSRMTPIYHLGLWMVILSFLFKVAAVPFHMWMPDVYEGAPTPVTGFMTTGLKAASFAIFVRVFMSTGYGNGLADMVQDNIHDLLWVIAVLTMVIGNLVALTQSNLKRMLAYSSIAHTGYLLVGLISGANSDQAYGAIALYMVAYSLMNLGAFVILGMISKRGDSGVDLQDLAGLGQRRPGLAFAMTIFMFSMAGVPPMAGFAAKYYLFYSAVQAGEIPLVVIAVLCSVISVYYYLRVLVYMYMRQPVKELADDAHEGFGSMVWAGSAVATMALLTIEMGVFPTALLSAVKTAMAQF